ncbi:L-fuculose-phosphate aldolase [Agathobaculum sp.]|uniref:L-fuculose-phosphate aldolase n=1 Tax=Agathobaculum sp. TaxID=2048138 RepID=UPI002A81B427|nr:L-fuculose-phosphate aldolase [Agathobaculum sp.]MDY3619170.1 L-fuculose-phosphate aldolase [Agathobaculum sp.]
MLLQAEREQVVEYGKAMIERGLTVGTFGNLSVYNEKENLFAISPSGMDYFKTEPADVVVMTPDGEKVDGDRKPSSEVDMHRIFYQKRPGIRSVVHTHSRFATTLACLGLGIPPLHYLIAYSGREVPCTPYVQFGTYELAQCALDTMGADYACLLGNHGLLACGGNISYTMDVAEQIEFCAELYYRARAVGEPKLLKDDEIGVVLESFKSYRQK